MDLLSNDVVNFAVNKFKVAAEDNRLRCISFTVQEAKMLMDVTEHANFSEVIDIAQYSAEDKDMPYYIIVEVRPDIRSR